MYTTKSLGVWGLLLCFILPTPTLFAQSIVCIDYNVPCTHREVLDENYGLRHDTAFVLENLPYNLQEGTNDLHFAMPCGIIQDMEIYLQMEHNNASAIEVGLSVENQHPSINGFQPMLLFDLVHPSECPSDTPLSLDVTFDAEATTDFEEGCMEGEGVVTGVYRPFGSIDRLNSWSRGHFADTWILRVENQSSGAGTITNAQIHLTFGFPPPYEIDSTAVANVVVTNELVYDPGCDTGSPFGAKIERAFSATKTDGTTETCIQTVGLWHPVLSEMAFPTDITIDCEDLESLYPHFTVPPSFGCQTISPDLHSLCDVSYVYQDLDYDTILGHSFRRIWSLTDWCNFTNTEFAQNIHIACVPHTISGRFFHENGEPYEEAFVVDLEGPFPKTTMAQSGMYIFEQTPMGTYAIHPQKNDFPLNGVSTYDLVLLSQHILGVNLLDSPYKLIAADANRDGNISTFDIILLRQLILYVITSLPDDYNWAFVPADYMFENPNNPLLEAYPTTIELPNLQADTIGLDFIAIKIGDLD